MAFRILGAGATKGVVQALRAQFEPVGGVDPGDRFGAVGTIKDQFLSGEPCDVIILTAKMIDELAQLGHVLPKTAAPLGRIGTGIAVRSGQPLPTVSDGPSLAATLKAAKGIYFPDPLRATAGIHFVNVLKRLGIHREVEPRLRPAPSGAIAMTQLAKDEESGMIGCAQITEILYTKGVSSAGLLVGEFELATMYSAAVSSRARDPALACDFVALLVSHQSTPLRMASGFEL